MTLHDRIERALRRYNALTMTEIAMEAGAARDETASALHELQDTDRVLMRNGFYRLSEKARG